MKLLLVLGSDKTFDNVSVFLKPLGFDLIRYRNVQKAMDNIDEIDPVGIIISAKDFPRHWKTMTRFVRYDRSLKDCSIIVLMGETFPKEEIDKAMVLEINGLVPESLDDPSAIEKIQNLLAHSETVDDKQTDQQLKPEPCRHIGFVFSHPADEKLITGIVKTISSNSVSFEPGQPGLAGKITVDTEIRHCSLKVGESILSPACVVRGTGKVIALDFLSFPDTEKETLDSYLENLLLEEFKARQKAAS